MSNSNDAIFKIDANQILAKLDAAAGQQAAKGIKHYTINTGVKDPPDNPDPKNIGKSNFDFKKDQVYQVGFVYEFPYQLPPQEKKDGGDKKDKDADKPIDADKKDLEKDDKKDDKDAEKIKKEIDKAEKYNEQFIKKIKKDALAAAKIYFTTFAGKENAAKIKESDMIDFLINPKATKPSQVEVKDYVLLKWDNKEAEKINKAAQEKANKAKKSETVTYMATFVIGYSIAIEEL